MLFLYRKTPVLLRRGLSANNTCESFEKKESIAETGG